MLKEYKDQRPGIGGRGQGSGIGDQGSPVKFAALVFFEEFNGASRGQGEMLKK